MIDLSLITGVILAGGQARRMGGMDKGLVELCGEPMCKIVLNLLTPQVGEVLVNANRNHNRYRAFGATVVADDITGYQGPLAGLVSAMKAAETPWVITVPCDGPFLNTDYVARMSEQVVTGIEIVVARDSKRMQPTYMLAHTKLIDDLGSFLAAGERKIDRWFTQHRFATCDFSDSSGCFININSEQERLQAEIEVMKNERA